MSLVRQRRDSSSGSEGGALRASKDRECPFCHQAFTSSSLGRHLDLFIRPHNPKQPDGVHKVDEIRKIRGRITRRQPKGIGKVKTNGLHDTPPASPYLVQEMREQNVVPSVEASSRYVNAMDWRSTGVIDGVDEKPHNPPPDFPARDSPSLEEQLETGKAAELALRDLVASIKAAQGLERPDDDLVSLSFPGLCLAVLPAPRSLFSTTPFADDNSWSLSAPGEKQRSALNKKLTGSALAHLDAAYDNWAGLPEQEQAEIWTLEVLRSWTRMKRAETDLQAQLCSAQQRIAHLESEYEYLSRCQLPREKLLAVPTTRPVSGKLPDLDAQSLIQEWRSKVRTVARPKKGRQSEVILREGPVNHLGSDYILHGSVFGVGGPMTRSEDPSPPRTRPEEILSATEHG